MKTLKATGSIRSRSATKATKATKVIQKTRSEKKRVSGTSARKSKSSHKSSVSRKSRSSKAPMLQAFEPHQCEDQMYEKAVEVINRGQKDAFYLFDVKSVDQRVKLWRKYLPDVQLCYAVKANSDEFIISRMIKLGTNFDCASKTEIDLVLNHGGKPDSIIFANPCKQVEQLEHAREVGVSLMTFDSCEEATKIKKIFPGARLVLRLEVAETDARTPMGNKFGAPEAFWG